MTLDTYTLWNGQDPLHSAPIAVIICQGAVPLSVVTYDNIKALQADEEILDTVAQALSDRNEEPTSSVVDDMTQCSDALADCLNLYIMVQDLDA
jgi:Co/Zn/Cd efflux system component